MDRLFLDANILFSAAYRHNAGLLALWELNAGLFSSHYALEEARVNLSTESQKRRLTRLAKHLVLFDAPAGHLPSGISLPEKDAPILLAAHSTARHPSHHRRFPPFRSLFRQDDRGHPNPHSRNLPEKPLAHESWAAESCSSRSCGFFLVTGFTEAKHKCHIWPL